MKKYILIKEDKVDKYAVDIFNFNMINRNKILILKKIHKNKKMI